MKGRNPKDYNPELCEPDPRKEVNERYDNTTIPGLERTSACVAGENTRYVIFVGGVADGRRIPDPGERYWIMQADFPVVPFGHPTSVPTEIRREKSIYLRERIRAEREECVIYVCDKLSVFEAIGKLIRGYPE